MISDLFRWFSGYRIIKTGTDYAASVSNILNVCGCRFITTGKTRDPVKFKVYRNDLGRVEELLKNMSIPVSISEKRGFPGFLKSVKTRPGLCLGCVIFAVINFYLSNIVWNITVDGNADFSDEQVIGFLENCGFTYGSFIPDVDFDALNSKIMAYNPDVAWISVNMDGTTASVQMTEAKHGEEHKIPEGIYANIIASEDGQISDIFVNGGQPSVAPGDIVKKGDLLVSGVIPLRDGGVRFSYPRGEVFAKTERKVTARIESVIDKKIYTGKKRSDHCLKIFNYSLNLLVNGRKNYKNYDKIERSERIILFGMYPLPVWLSETEYREYESVPVSLSSAEATALAEETLRRESDSVLENCELLKKTVFFSAGEDGISIEYRYLVLTDIALPVEFELSPE